MIIFKLLLGSKKRGLLISFLQPSSIIVKTSFPPPLARSLYFSLPLLAFALLYRPPPPLPPLLFETYNKEKENITIYAVNKFKFQVKHCAFTFKI